MSSLVSAQMPVAWVFRRRKSCPRQRGGMPYEFHPDETSAQLPTAPRPVKMFHQDETSGPFQTAKKRESPKRTPNGKLRTFLLVQRPAERRVLHFIYVFDAFNVRLRIGNHPRASKRLPSVLIHPKAFGIGGRRLFAGQQFSFG